MKKMLLAAVVILMFSGLVGAQQLYQVSGGFVPPATPTNTAVTVSSLTVTTVAAVPYGVQRIFVNNGTGTLYMSKASSTLATVTGSGLPLFTHTTYIEDKFFGIVYFASAPGTTASNDSRYEVLRIK